jgi:uncharacterized protein
MMKICFLQLIFLSCLQAFSQNLNKLIEDRNYGKVEALLKSGNKANDYDKDGLFPLWRAVTINDLAMVRLLLQYGAQVDQKTKAPAALLPWLSRARKDTWR